VSSSFATPLSSLPPAPRPSHPGSASKPPSPKSRSLQPSECFEKNLDRTRGHCHELWLWLTPAFLLPFHSGFFECGLFPGLSFYLSSWYPRKELGLRIALFFSAATLAGVRNLLLSFTFPFLLPSFPFLRLRLINVWCTGLRRNPRIRTFEDERNRREGRMVVDRESRLSIFLELARKLT